MTKTELITYLEVCASLGEERARGGDGLAYVRPDLLREAISLIRGTPDEPAALHDPENQCVECYKYRNAGAIECGNCNLKF